MKELTILDYGSGNLRSLQKSLEFLGCKAVITDDPEKIKKAKALVLPGQGAFEGAIKNLESRGLINHIKDYIAQEKPFLGICLGFQLLFEESHENGIYKGLGVFPGMVKVFDFKNSTENKGLKIPHMGWNNLDIVQDMGGVHDGLGEDPYVYFVHSYYVETDCKEIISTKTSYGIEFVSSIQAKNLYATQFHPEKSGKVGMGLLKNFISNI
jgi:imidazole glycerol-phosphate synthase subunit HisH